VVGWGGGGWGGGGGGGGGGGAREGKNRGRNRGEGAKEKKADQPEGNDPVESQQGEMTGTTLGWRRGKPGRAGPGVKSENSGSDSSRQIRNMTRLPSSGGEKKVKGDTRWGVWWGPVGPRGGSRNRVGTGQPQQKQRKKKTKKKKKKKEKKKPTPPQRDA